MSIKNIATILFAFIILSSCKKKGETVLTNNTNSNKENFSFGINGLVDASIERIGKVRIPILVEKKSGDSEKVGLTSIDVPDGMTVTFDPLTTSIAPYNTAVVIETYRAAIGDYTIKIRGASPTAGLQDKSINISVMPYSNEATGLVGEYSESGACTPAGNVDHAVSIAKASTANNRVLIKGIFSGIMSNEVYADLSSSSKTLTIPSQVQSGVTFEGNGVYDDNTITIVYTVKGAAINESCSTKLTRK